MSTQLLIESMEKLLILHNQLHETVVEKTEAIKNNDMQNTYSTTSGRTKTCDGDSNG